jgi:hypothetical protein
MNLLTGPDLASNRSQIPGSPSASGYRLDRKEEPFGGWPNRAQLSQSIYPSP